MIEPRLIAGTEALGLDRLFIDVDGHRRLGSDGVHERGVEPGPKRPAAQLLVEQQDALHGRGGSAAAMPVAAQTPAHSTAQMTAAHAGVRNRRV